MAISVKVDPLELWIPKAFRFLGNLIDAEIYSLEANLGWGVPIYDFDAKDFGDFIWQSLFAKTLSAREFETIRNARYASIRPSWDLLGRVAVRKMRLGTVADLPRLNCQKYDVFLSQTPFPASLQ